MNDESIRLKTKLQRLEDVLEKQRWSQKEQLIKFEKSIDKLERDRDEQRFAADYNKEQVARYQLVLASLAEGIYAMDADGNVLAMNEQAAKMLSEEEITPYLLQASSFHNSPQSTIVEVVEAREQIYQITARPLIDQEGKIVGGVASVRKAPHHM